MNFVKSVDMICQARVDTKISEFSKLTRSPYYLKCSNKNINHSEKKLEFIFLNSLARIYFL